MANGKTGTGKVLKSLLTRPDWLPQELWADMDQKDRTRSIEDPETVRAELIEGGFMDAPDDRATDEPAETSDVEHLADAINLARKMDKAFVAVVSSEIDRVQQSKIAPITLREEFRRVFDAETLSNPRYFPLPNSMAYDLPETARKFGLPEGWNEPCDKYKLRMGTRDKVHSVYANLFDKSELGKATLSWIKDWDNVVEKREGRKTELTSEAPTDYQQQNKLKYWQNRRTIGVALFRKAMTLHRQFEAFAFHLPLLSVDYVRDMDKDGKLAGPMNTTEPIRIFDAQQLSLTMSIGAFNGLDVQKIKAAGGRFVDLQNSLKRGTKKGTGQTPDAPKIDNSQQAISYIQMLAHYVDPRSDAEERFRKLLLPLLEVGKPGADDLAETLVIVSEFLDPLVTQLQDRVDAIRVKRLHSTDEKKETPRREQLAAAFRKTAAA